MTISKQLRAMARVARAHNAKPLAVELNRVARWSQTFKGWHARPYVGPEVPSVACLHAAATQAALIFARDQGPDCHSAMARAYAGN
jgi:hypothetical protein